MQDVDRAEAAPQTMTHRHMLSRWRRGHALPVAPNMTEYVACDGVWYRRVPGGWASIPDGAFALALSAGQARLAQLRDSMPEALHGSPRSNRDPWSAARNRLRMGRSCPYADGR